MKQEEDHDHTAGESASHIKSLAELRDGAYEPTFSRQIVNQHTFNISEYDLSMQQGETIVDITCAISDLSPHAQHWATSFPMQRRQRPQVPCNHCAVEKFLAFFPATVWMSIIT